MTIVAILLVAWVLSTLAWSRALERQPRLNFKRPLSATEMLVFLKRLALWSDARDTEGWP